MIIGTGRLEHPLDHRFERAPGYPWWTLGVGLEGGMRFVSRGRESVVGGRTLTLIRPRTPYRVAFADDAPRWRETWVIFAPRPDWSALMDWPEIAPGLLVLDARDGRAAEALTLADQVHDVSVGALPERLRFADNLLERALLLAHLANPNAAHANLHPAVRAALNAVATRWSEPLDVAGLARIAGCSPSHLAHLFTGQVGATPMAYLEAQRIERARHLLAATTMAVKEIAAAVGFSNPFHFSTRFRRHVGRSPSAYRHRPG